MSIQVESLTKVYGTQHAVDAIDFSATSGEILGFLGPNGAGKSTTMKMITGYVRPTSGNATVCGFSVLDDAQNVKKHIGYLPEHNPLYGDLYVREYLTFVGRLHGLSGLKAKVDDMIERTGLTREYKKPIRALSKGYRQRVGLAQAMIHDPEVLILDEPTSGLDPNQLSEIRGLIQQLGKEKTVIFSTHIMQEVQALCDRVMIINQGKIVANGPIDSLDFKVEEREKIYLQLSTNVPINRIKKLKGVDTVELIQDVYTCVGTPDIMRQSIWDWAVQEKNRIKQLQVVETSIEEIFRKLTS